MNLLTLMILHPKKLYSVYHISSELLLRQNVGKSILK